MSVSADEYTLVTRKVKNVIRDSALYYFVRDNNLQCLSKYNKKHILRDKDPERPSWLIFLPIDANTPCLFPGLRIKNHHISLDKLYANESSASAKGFTCAHYSVYLEDINTGEEHIKHVYFNRYGAEVLQDGNKDLLASEQSLPAARLLLEIIAEKDLEYVALYQNITAKVNQLAYISSEAEKAKQIQDLIADCEKINLYNDVEKDMRGVLLESKLRDSLNAKKDNVKAIPQQIEKPSADRVQHSTTKSKKKNKKAKPCVSNNNITGLEYLEDSEWYVTNQKIDFFKAAVMAGNLEEVRLLFAEISIYADMLTIEMDLLEILFNTKPEDNPNLLGQIEVAKYLYEVSSSYNAVLYLQNRKFYTQSDYKLMSGLLVNLFRKNNLLAFQMVLEQGVSVISDQMIIESKGISALASIICVYDYNPDIRFIELLFEHGATTTLSYNILSCSKVNLQRFMQKGKISVLDKKGPNIFAKDTSKSSLSFLSIIESALQLALSFDYVNYLDLIRLLTTHSSLLQLVQATSIILDSVKYRSVFLLDAADKDFQVFASQSQAYNFLNFMAAGSRFKLIFYPNFDNLSAASIDCAKHLLMSINSVSNNTSDLEKARSMNLFCSKADSLIKSGKIDAAIDLYMASRWFYYLIDSYELRHHELLIQVFCKSCKHYSGKSQGVIAKTYEVGMMILNTLSVEELDELIKRPVVSYFISKAIRVISAEYPKVLAVYNFIQEEKQSSARQNLGLLSCSATVDSEKDQVIPEQNSKVI